MPTAIDGSNLGGYLGGRRGSRDRRAVLDRLLPWARAKRRAILVFDGSEEPTLATAYGSLEVRWSGSRSADSVILDLIRKRPKDWRIVTDDAALATAGTALGASSESVEKFLERLPKGEPRSDEIAVDVEEWEAWFRKEGSRQSS